MLGIIHKLSYHLRCTMVKMLSITAILKLLRVGEGQIWYKMASGNLWAAP